MRMMRARRYWRSPAFGIDLADAVTDDAVRVVIEVRAGRREAVDEAALDERDEARLVEAGGRHRAAEREEDARVVLRAAPHELERRALLTPDVGGEHRSMMSVGRLLAGDPHGVNVALLLEALSEGQSSPCIGTHLLVALRPSVKSSVTLAALAKMRLKCTGMPDCVAMGALAASDDHRRGARRRAHRARHVRLRSTCRSSSRGSTSSRRRSRTPGSGSVRRRTRREALSRPPLRDARLRGERGRLLRPAQQPALGRARSEVGHPDLARARVLRDGAARGRSRGGRRVSGPLPRARASAPSATRGARRSVLRRTRPRRRGAREALRARRGASLGVGRRALTAEMVAAASPRAFLTRWLLNLRGVYLSRGDLSRALLVVDRLVSLNPARPRAPPRSRLARDAPRRDHASA